MGLCSKGRSTRHAMRLIALAKAQTTRRVSGRRAGNERSSVFDDPRRVIAACEEGASFIRARVGHSRPFSVLKDCAFSPDLSYKLCLLIFPGRAKGLGLMSATFEPAIFFGLEAN